MKKVLVLLTLAIMTISMSPRADKETICSNSSGWIVIDNPTGVMTKTYFDNSPSGSSSITVDMNEAMEFCFQGIE